MLLGVLQFDNVRMEELTVNSGPVTIRKKEGHETGNDREVKIKRNRM